MFPCKYLYTELSPYFYMNSFKESQNCNSLYKVISSKTLEILLPTANLNSHH